MDGYRQTRYSIVIAAYNEEENIGKVLANLGKPSGCLEIIVVDDGSKDRTATIAEHYGASGGVRTFRVSGQFWGSFRG